MRQRGISAWYNEGCPPDDQPCEVVAEDETGEYQQPFVCVSRNGAWYAAGKTKPLSIKIIGWRAKYPARG